MQVNWPTCWEPARIPCDAKTPTMVFRPYVGPTWSTQNKTDIPILTLPFWLSILMPTCYNLLLWCTIWNVPTTCPQILLPWVSIGCMGFVPWVQLYVFSREGIHNPIHPRNPLFSWLYHDSISQCSQTIGGQLATAEALVVLSPYTLMCMEGCYRVYGEKVLWQYLLSTYTSWCKSEYRPLQVVLLF